jgi:hypothetical protein
MPFDNINPFAPQPINYNVPRNNDGDKDVDINSPEFQNYMFGLTDSYMSDPYDNVNPNMDYSAEMYRNINPLSQQQIQSTPTIGDMSKQSPAGGQQIGQQQLFSPFMNYAPYGTPEWSAFSAGRGFQTVAGVNRGQYDYLSPEEQRRMKGRGIFAGVTGTLGAGLGIAKSGMAGAALQKRENFQRQNMLENMREGQTMAQNLPSFYGSGFYSGQGAMFQDGGSIGEKITGNYIIEDPLNSNVNVESNEFIQSPEGQIAQVHPDANRHHEGGVNVNLQAGSKVLSDNIVLSKAAREFLKSAGVQADGKTLTFAQAMERVEDKIGYKKLVEEQAKHADKYTKLQTELSELEDPLSTGTLRANNYAYSEVMTNIEKQKQELEPTRNKIFNFLFEAQEADKEFGDPKKLRKPVTQTEMANGGITQTTPQSAQTDIKGYMQDLTQVSTPQNLTQGYYQVDPMTGQMLPLPIEKQVSFEQNLRRANPSNVQITPTGRTLDPMTGQLTPQMQDGGRTLQDIVNGVEVIPEGKGYRLKAPFNVDELPIEERDALYDWAGSEYNRIVSEKLNQAQSTQGQVVTNQPATRQQQLQNHPLKVRQDGGQIDPMTGNIIMQNGNDPLTISVYNTMGEMVEIPTTSWDNTQRKGFLKESPEFSKFFKQTKGQPLYTHKGRFENPRTGEVTNATYISPVKENFDPTAALYYKPSEKDISKGVFNFTSPITEESQEGLQIKQDGGEVEQVFQGVVEMLMQGAQPQEIFPQLVQMGMDEQEATMLIEEAVQIASQMAQQQEMPQEEMMMQDGGYKVQRSSERKGKTHKVTAPDGTVKFFGDPNLKNKPNNEDAKKAWYARHKKSLDNNPHFRAYARETWQDGGEIPEEQQEIVGGVIDYLLEIADPTQREKEAQKAMEDLATDGINIDLMPYIFPEEQMMQDGGQTDPTMQLIQMFAQISGIDPEQIMAELQQMPPEEAEQMLAQMEQEVMAAQQGQAQQASQEMYDPMTGQLIAQNGVRVRDNQKIGNRGLAQDSKGYRVPTNIPIDEKIVETFTTRKELEDLPITTIQSLESLEKGTYGVQKKDLEALFKEHSWYFTNEDVRQRFIDDIKKAKGKPSDEVKKFQKAHAQKLGSDLKDAGYSDDAIKRYLKKYSFGSGDDFTRLQAIDGLLGDYTYTRPVINIKKTEAGESVVEIETPTGEEIEAPLEDILNPYQRLDAARQPLMDIRTARRLPPDPLQAPAFVQARFQDPMPTKQSWEQPVQQIQSAARAATSMIGSMPGGQAAAQIANTQRIASQQASEAVQKVESGNIDRMQRYYDQRMGVRNQEEMARVQGLRAYDTLATTAMDKTRQDVRNYYDTVQSDRLNYEKDLRNLQLAQNVYFPTYDYQGNVIRETQPQFIFNPLVAQAAQPAQAQNGGKIYKTKRK